MNVHKLQIASHLPDDAVTARQFSQAVAVDEVHACERSKDILEGPQTPIVAALGALGRKTYV